MAQKIVAVNIEFGMVRIENDYIRLVSEYADILYHINITAFANGKRTPEFIKAIELVFDLSEHLNDVPCLVTILEKYNFDISIQ